MNENKLLDSPDFIEVLIKHLARSPAVHSSAISAGLTADDFMTTSDYGIAMYREFADIALSLTAPIDGKIFLTGLKDKLDRQVLQETQLDNILKLYSWIYEDDVPELNPEFYSSKILPFIKRRRSEKIKLANKENTDEMLQQLNLLNFELKMAEAGDMGETVNPFAKLILPDNSVLIPLGIRGVDTFLGGLSYGEYGLIIGFTGSGKTALTTQSALCNATTGRKAMIISLEDTKEGMTFRMYSNRYNLDYSKLKKAQLNLELQQKFNNDIDAEGFQALLDNLRIIDLKGRTPISPENIGKRIIHEYETTGFIPDVVYIDQMQFLCPDQKVVGLQRWQEEERISADIDTLSHITIGDINTEGHGFALWVNHQAKGKVKLRITRDEIQGFKGIDQKTDTTLYIGRNGPMSDEFLIGSLKSRHSANFEVHLKGEMQYMRLLEKDSSIAIQENRLESDQPLLLPNPE